MKRKRDTWVISDTHLFHENILKFTDKEGKKIRSFSSIKEMNECILEKWNSVVKPGDIVYHLGDVFIGDSGSFLKLWPKFHGRKRLILGNHDDARFLSQGALFQKVQLWRLWKEEKLIFSHIPLHRSSIDEGNREGFINVHGHIHQNSSPEGPYKNVSCEVVDYTPVNIEDLIG